MLVIWARNSQSSLEVEWVRPTLCRLGFGPLGPQQLCCGSSMPEGDEQLMRVTIISATDYACLRGLLEHCCGGSMLRGGGLRVTMCPSLLKTAMAYACCKGLSVC